MNIKKDITYLNEISYVFFYIIYIQSKRKLFA